eukprot:289019-Prymnesium_polylepis.2
MAANACTTVPGSMSVMKVSKVSRRTISIASQYQKEGSSESAWGAHRERVGWGLRKCWLGTARFERAQASSERRAGAGSRAGSNVMLHSHFFVKKGALSSQSFFSRAISSLDMPKRSRLWSACGETNCTTTYSKTQGIPAEIRTKKTDATERQAPW